MKKAIAMKWAATLRSGDYKQGVTGKLKSDTGFCCLGVLCEISRFKAMEINSNLVEINANQQVHYHYYGHSADLPRKIMLKTGMNNSLGMLKKSEVFNLSALNDVGIELDDGKMERLTFDEIADIIQIFYKEL